MSQSETIARLDRGFAQEARAQLGDMFKVATDSVTAQLCLPPYLPKPVAGKNLIIGAGKAAAAMAQVTADHMKCDLTGIVVTRYGHALPRHEIPDSIEVIEAGHPLPDDAGADAAARILKAVADLGPQDQLIALISGGGSALLAMPADGVPLADKQDVTRALLHSGASIAEINCVRKHLSRIKGGRLALAANGAKITTLAMSDIPGDDASLIASGPTLPDRTTLSDARRILELHGITPPASVTAALTDPANETPSADHPAFAGNTVKIIARAANALSAAGQLAVSMGYKPVYLGDDLEGNAAELGTVHAALALHHARKGGRWALLSGGETTVVVNNPEGRGGRNTEYLLSLCLALNGARGIAGISCDTDGIDGTQDNAGALFTPDTLVRAREAGLDGAEMLRDNLSYDYFKTLNDLVMTGPTRTNVNDFRAILIDT